MARHGAGHGGWWTPPPQGAEGDGGGAGGLNGQLVRDLIAAMGASIVNTNNNVVALGQMMANGQNGDHGYRLLKPNPQPLPAAADGSGCRNISMSTPLAAVQTGVAYPTEQARLQAQAAANRSRAVHWSDGGFAYPSPSATGKMYSIMSDTEELENVTDLVTRAGVQRVTIPVSVTGPGSEIIVERDDRGQLIYFSCIANGTTNDSEE